MLLNLKTVAIAALLSTTALMASAAKPPTTNPVGMLNSGFVVNVGSEKTVALQDGSTLHVYSDGKMAMENRLGNAVLMAEGQAMQAKDGSTISMRGDEVARLADEIRAQNHR